MQQNPTMRLARRSRLAPSSGRSVARSWARALSGTGLNGPTGGLWRGRRHGTGGGEPLEADVHRLEQRILELALLEPVRSDDAEHRALRGAPEPLPGPLVVAHARLTELSQLRQCG